MLIFVQVYRTIDKNLRSLLGFGRTKESKGIKQKGSLKRLKRTAPEVKVLLKSSAPEVMTSSEASSSEASHQKLKITRSCSSSEDARLKASKVVQ